MVLPIMTNITNVRKVKHLQSVKLESNTYLLQNFFFKVEIHFSKQTSPIIVSTPYNFIKVLVSIETFYLD